MLILYVALTIIASLNRETGLLLVGLYYAAFGLSRATWGLAALWAVITILLHIAFGAAPIQYSLEATLATNLKTLPHAALSNALLLPLWVAVYQGYRRANDGLRRLMGIALLYVIAVMFGGLWQEIRLLLPIIPLVIPIMLYGETS